MEKLQQMQGKDTGDWDAGLSEESFVPSPSLKPRRRRFRKSKKKSLKKSKNSR